MEYRQLFFAGVELNGASLYVKSEKITKNCLMNQVGSLGRNGIAQELDTRIQDGFHHSHKHRK